MIKAHKGIIPNKQDQHDPELKDIDGNTVAMLLVQHKIIPPQQWYHNPNVQNKQGKTVFDICNQVGITCPEYFKINKIFIDKFGNTQAMIQARQGIIPYKQYHHEPSLKNINGFTVAMLLADKGIIPPKEWYHNKFIRGKYKYCFYTVQNFLQQNNVEVPEQWSYDNIVDNYDNTQAMIQARSGKIPDKQWHHDPNQTNMDNCTVAMFLAKNGFIPPKEWYHKPELQNNDGYTVALIYAQKGLIPPKEWEHDKFIKNCNNQTVAEILSRKSVILPQQWMISEEENSNIFNNIKYNLQKYQLPVPRHIKDDELTIFDQTIYRLIPDIAGHKSDEQDEDGFTVAMILARNGIVPKNFTSQDPSIQNIYGQTVAMYIAQYCKEIPDQEWHHSPELMNNDKQTVAMLLVQNGIIPSNIWIHNKYIRGNYFNKNGFKIGRYTVQNFLQENNMYIPEQWKYEVVDDQDNTYAMIQARNEQMPDKQYYHDADQTNIYGETVAIILAQKGIVPPKEWEHNKFISYIYEGEYQYKYNQTVAEILSEQGIIPSQHWMITWDENEKIFNNIKYNLQWKQLPIPMHVKNDELTIFDQACYGIIPDITGHKPDKQDENGFTIAMILAYNNINIPKEWYHEPELQNKYGMTVAMYQTKSGKIPDKQYYHDPNIQNNEGKTVAMMLLQHSQDIPKEWYHKPELQNNDGYTVALIYAQKGLIPPKEWEHDKFIKYKYFDEIQYNYYDYTIAEILSRQGIVPSQQWMITKDEDEWMFNNIKFNLQRYEYEYIDGKFVRPIPQTEILNNICQICLNEGEQQFIKTKCNHKICLECFKELQKQKQHKLCPLCRQHNWYKKIVENNDSSYDYDDSYNSEIS